MSVPIETATQQAVTRLITAMQTNLGTAITAVKDAGLVLPSPIDGAYYWLPRGVDAGGFSPGHEVYVMVYEDGQSRSVGAGGHRAGGPTYHNAESSLRLAVHLEALLAPQDALPLNGKTTFWVDLEALRADRYSGALLKTLYQYGAGAGVIHTMDLVSAKADVTEVEKTRRVAVKTVWSITQDVQVPQNNQ